MKPDVKVFTKDDPCTKLHLWQCFRARRGFRKVELAEAHSQIGVNAPKNMLNRGYAEVVEQRRSEYYQLTDEGKEWLTKGILSYVKRHPEEATEAKYLPRT